MKKGNSGVENLEDTFYWLNELTEIFDPYFVVEKKYKVTPKYVISTQEKSDQDILLWVNIKI
ncbi:MAG: hypothetical protein ABI441_04850 [Flavobacterium sp.]